MRDLMQVSLSNWPGNGTSNTIPDTFSETKHEAIIITAQNHVI